MPDHTHVITSSDRSIKDTLRFLNGVSAKRILDYLKENKFESSLMKLRQAEKEKKYKHSVWQHHPDAFPVIGEQTLMQKVNYIHQNPVRAGLVDHADEYRYSSARIWHQRSLENEPLRMDLDQIEWRTAA